MITYNYVKLLAEIVAFISVTGGLYLMLSLLDVLKRFLERRDLIWITLGVAVFWAGYFVNVLNDVVPTEFMKVADDVLVAIGMTIVMVASIRISRGLRLRVKPQMILNGSPELKSGAYLVHSLPLDTIIRLLSGRKILAVTRFPNRWKSRGIPHIWVTNVEHPNAISPTRLAPLLHFAVKEADEDTFVILDSLDYLVLQNGTEPTLKFILSLKDHLLSRNAGIILIINPATVDPSLMKILEKEFEALEVKP